MSDLKKCPNCANIQLRDKQFCGQCGVDLSNVKTMELYDPSDGRVTNSGKPTHYQEAEYQYHLSGRRLFDLIYTLIVISIIINIVMFLLVCIFSASSMALISGFIQTLLHAIG